MNKRIIFVLLIGYLFLTSFDIYNKKDVRDDLDWLNGNWAGLGYQPTITSPWTIKFFCSVEKKVFTIQYPSLSCQGAWALEKVERNHVVFKEQIVEGEHNCIPTGIVVVTKVDDNHISYSYFIERDGKLVLDAFSTLTRV